MTSDDWDRPIHEILRERTLTTTSRTAFASLRGDAAHAVLAETLRIRAERGTPAARAAVAVLVDEHVRDPRFGRLNRARIQVAGLVYRYLDLFAPDAGADFAAAEYRIGDATIDLVWKRDNVGVWFDEIKTGAAAFGLHTSDPFDASVTGGTADLRHLDPSQVAQVTRYLTCGIEEFGPNFLGVRLINLREHTASRHFVPDGTVRPLPANPPGTPYTRPECLDQSLSAETVRL